MKSYIIGVDLGGTFIKIGLVRSGEIVAKRTIEASSGSGLQSRLADLTHSITALLTDAQVASNDFAGVGVCFPGLADSDAGKVLSTNAKYDDAAQLDLAAWAKNTFGGEFYIDNDARMAAVGEWKFGAARAYDSSVTMTFGTGIGSGVILEGRVLKGKHHQAGCLGGHFVIDYRGRRCSCGNIGCAEAMSSTFFLNEIISQQTAVSPDFRKQYAPFDFEKIFRLADGGNPDAVIVRNTCMDIWAANIVTHIHAYDPEIVVLSGGIMRSAATILPYVRQRVEELAWTPWGKVQIVASELMDSAAILGVADCVNNKNK